jgi:cytolysin (calcineurin-like family phosphatase)
MRRRLLIALPALIVCGLLAGCAASAPRDEAQPVAVTFIVGSDPHYKADPADPARDAIRTGAVRRMNTLAGTPWPEAAGGGPIAQPRGVLMLGDLVDDGKHRLTQAQWDLFVADFGLNGRGGLLKYPVYEGVGNHDGPPDGIVQTAIRQRNKQRAGLAAVSADGLHYSWDWGNVHFVLVNLYPADKPDPATRYNAQWHAPQGALTFLKEDLAKHVGASGRPVIVAQHYDYQGTDWWTEADRTAAWDALKAYNVVAIFHGHTGTAVYQWKGITIVNTGNTGSGFFVAEVAPEALRVAYTRNDGTWQHVARKPLDGRPVGERAATR